MRKIHSTKKKQQHTVFSGGNASALVTELTTTRRDSSWCVYAWKNLHTFLSVCTHLSTVDRMRWKTWLYEKKAYAAITTATAAAATVKVVRFDLSILCIDINRYILFHKTTLFLSGSSSLNAFNADRGWIHASLSHSPFTVRRSLLLADSKSA